MNFEELSLVQILLRSGKVVTESQVKLDLCQHTRDLEQAELVTAVFKGGVSRALGFSVDSILQIG